MRPVAPMRERVVGATPRNPKPLRERCGDLKNYWYAAAQSQSVTKRRPLGRVVLGEMVVLWRSEDGKALAMQDRCLHRNALLSEGELFDNCIGCPYHGWTYDASGLCTNVPSEGPEGGTTEEKRLHVYPSKEQDGLVWLWMGDGSPDRLPERQPFPMPHWGQKGWGTYYMETRFANGVTNLVENFMDVPHTVFVHKGWFRSRARKQVSATVERTPNSVLVTYHQPKDSIGFTGRLVNPRGLPMVHTDKFYMPNTTRVDYVFGEENTAFVITSTCTPISDLETHVFTLISFKLGIFNFLGHLFLPPYTRKVIEQDVGIMEVQGRALRHYGSYEFSSTPADTLHVHIEALREWAESGAVTEPPKPVTDAIEFWI